MNHPGLYNPCKDGFVAKAWECLRRNELFGEFLTGIGDREKGRSYENRMAGAQIPYLFFELIIEDRLFTEPKLRLDVSRAWPELSDGNRQLLERTLASRDSVEALTMPSRGELIGSLLEFPKNVQFPIWMKNWFVDPNGRQKINAFVNSLLSVSMTHDLIAVPKVIWDSAHLREIRRDVDRQLKRPVRNLKHFKSGGQAFGTRREWKAFLDFKAWDALLPDLPMARKYQLVAWENAGALPEPSVTSGSDVMEFLSIRRTAPKRAPDIQKRVCKILKCINGAFPEFWIG